MDLSILEKLLTNIIDIKTYLIVILLGKTINFVKLDPPASFLFIGSLYINSPNARKEYNDFKINRKLIFTQKNNRVINSDLLFIIY